jgi:hypothetical protein
VGREAALFATERRAARGSMKQREVQDAENVRWVCVQALAGVDGAAAEQAVTHMESDGGTVPVVCTPSGGAQTVRLELERGWDEAVSDESLLSAIAAARESASHG